MVNKKNKSLIILQSFEKFCLGCKNIDKQARSGRHKSMDSEAVLQVIEANMMSSTWRLSY